MKTVPCYGCNERTAECHSTCSKYKDWRQYKDKLNAVRAGVIKARRDADDLRAEGIKNVTRGNRK